MSRMKPAVLTVSYILLYVLLVVGVYSLSRQGYRFCHNIFGVVRAAQEPGEDIAFRVERGEDFETIAGELEKKGIIEDRYSFYIRVRLMDSRRIILRPGDYMLNNSMTYEQIINRLTVSEGID